MNMLKLLKDKTKSVGYIEYENIAGQKIRSGFEWNRPATIKKIESFEKKNGISLPKKYIEFLRMSNGARIYMDVSGRGYKLLSVDEMIERTNILRNAGIEIGKDWIVFLETLFSTDVLLFDLNNPDAQMLIVDGNFEFPIKDWQYLRGDFDTLIERLFEANGAPYWRWSIK